MRVIKENHNGISTILAFALIPLSGFATDIYIPSLPAMANHLNVSNAAVQLSLILFMISAGVSQLFVGSILDSFGRFRINILSLFVFSLASFTIALVPDIYVIYAMRIIQGITVSLIVVGKRAYFVDIYSGDKLKNYTSLFSIAWSTAPIIAPFIGGFLQSSFGWQSNFYFLGASTLVLLVLELIFSGETLKTFAPFKAKNILNIYKDMLSTPDYRYGLVIIGTSYATLIIYGLTSPFVIEHVFHYSPVVTGYSSLFSGIALMTGGIISKMMIKRSFSKKVSTAILLQFSFAVLMIVASSFNSNLFMLIGFTLGIHLMSGFIFNNVFAYCLGRFTKNAGIASGLTGGSIYTVSSIFSYGLLNLIVVKSQLLIGVAFLTFIMIEGIMFVLFRRAKMSHEASKAAEAMALA